MMLLASPPTPPLNFGWVGKREEALLVLNLVLKWRLFVRIDDYLENKAHMGYNQPFYHSFLV